jgi:hypothetical protein
MSDNTVPSLPHLGVELRRIGVMTSIVFVIIAAMTLLLGG